MSKLFKNQQNLSVDLPGGGMGFALMWESEGMRYHVWVTNDEHLTPEPTIFQNPAKDTKRGDAGHFQTRRYTFDGENAGEWVRRNMVKSLIETAKERGFFDAARKKYAQEQAAERAGNRAAYQIKLAQEAGPQMLAVLKAISEFWQEADSETANLNACALIFSRDDKVNGEKTIAEAVRDVIRQAETGGAVQL
jgi:hypothetical protein